MPGVRALAQQHLFPHFTRGSTWHSSHLPVIVRGEGCYVYDERGNRFLVTRIPKYKAPFGPLMPGIRHFPNTLGESVPEGGNAAELSSLKTLVSIIEEEGPETTAAVFAEPVQNFRGALVPPDGYWPELRAICNRYDVLPDVPHISRGISR